jgi:hypothetical protein
VRSIRVRNLHTHSDGTLDPVSSDNITTRRTKVSFNLTVNEIKDNDKNLDDDRTIYHDKEMISDERGNRRKEGETLNRR